MWDFECECLMAWDCIFLRKSTCYLGRRKALWITLHYLPLCVNYEMNIIVSHFQSQTLDLKASLYDAKNHNKARTLESAISVSNYSLIFLSWLDRIFYMVFNILSFIIRNVTAEIQHYGILLNLLLKVIVVNGFPFQNCTVLSFPKIFWWLAVSFFIYFKLY